MFNSALKKIEIYFDGSVKGRIDHVLLPLFQCEMKELSRARFQNLITQGFLMYDGDVILKSNQKATAGIYFLHIHEAAPLDLVPTVMNLDILYHDEDLIVLNKPAFLPVHPGPGHYDYTLVHGLLGEFKDSLSGIGGVQRPGIVHRLDKDTSGLMVVAKHDQAHHFLSSQFTDRTLSRRYTAFVFGRPNPLSGRIHTRMGRHPSYRQKMSVLGQNASSSDMGKEAITDYRVMSVLSFGAKQEHHVSIVECILLTGRTHQIRVHMQYKGHPIIGDPIYGKRTISASFPKAIGEFPRQALHAHFLCFLHPRTREKMEFHAPLPKDMDDLRTSVFDQN